jgi:hypothetical protein
MREMRKNPAVGKRLPVLRGLRLMSDLMKDATREPQKVHGLTVAQMDFLIAVFGLGMFVLGLALGKLV